MAGARKVAISMHQHLLVEIDAEASRSNISRSAFIRQAVEAALKQIRGQRITDELNRIYSDPEVAEEARREAELFLMASPLVEEPEEW